MTVVIGTAGHIDHGKTSLLRALTGIDADRLPEERARGMTIDVGYVHLTLEDGSELDFVDVPGHDRLIGNMLVGAGEIDAALLVVAADDGPRAQTREHLELLDALGISIGLAVVTKIDAVEPGRVADVVAAVREVLGGTTLAGAPVLAASSLSGVGLEDVRTALLATRDRALASVELEPSASRLAIDRVFTVRGRGTVVTGTLRGRPLERGAVLRVVPGLQGAAVRVRETQVHSRSVDRAGPGRVALNVVSVGGDVVLERGIVLTDDPAVVQTDRLLVAARPPAADRTAGVLHLATSRVPGVIAASGRNAIDLADGRRTAIVRLDRPVAAAPGDRFVLRRPSPAGTLAGGRILDPEPLRGVARRRMTPERVRALDAAAGPIEGRAASLDLHGMLGGPPGHDPEVAPDLVEELGDVLIGTVAERGSIGAAEILRIGATTLRRRVGPLAGADRAVAARLDELVALGRLDRRGGTIHRPGTATDGVAPELAEAMDRLVGLLSVASPPALRAAATAAGCPPDGIRRLERDGRIVRVDDDLAWAAATWSELAARALELARAAPLTPAAYRDATGTSRKYVMGILEELDRRAILRRTPAGHVPGPRATAQAGAVR